MAYRRGGRGRRRFGKRRGRTKVKRFYTMSRGGTRL